MTKTFFKTKKKGYKKQLKIVDGYFYDEYWGVCKGTGPVG